MRPSRHTIISKGKHENLTNAYGGTHLHPNIGKPNNPDLDESIVAALQSEHVTNTLKQLAQCMKDKKLSIYKGRGHTFIFKHDYVGEFIKFVVHDLMQKLASNPANKIIAQFSPQSGIDLNEAFAKILSTDSHALPSLLVDKSSTGAMVKHIIKTIIESHGTGQFSYIYEWKQFLNDEANRSLEAQNLKAFFDADYFQLETSYYNACMRKVSLLLAKTDAKVTFNAKTYDTLKFQDLVDIVQPEARSLFASMYTYGGSLREEYKHFKPFAVLLFKIRNPRIQRAKELALVQNYMKDGPQISDIDSKDALLTMDQAIEKLNALGFVHKGQIRDQALSNFLRFYCVAYNIRSELAQHSNERYFTAMLTQSEPSQESLNLALFVLRNFDTADIRVWQKYGLPTPVSRKKGAKIDYNKFMDDLLDKRENIEFIRTLKTEQMVEAQPYLRSKKNKTPE